MAGHRRAAEDVATGADVTQRQLRYFAMLGAELNTGPSALIEAIECWVPYAFDRLAE